MKIFKKLLLKINRHLEKMAKSNYKQFGDKKLNCCTINKRK